MVRFARDDDFEFVKSTWKNIFDDPKKFVDWNFKKNYNPKNTIIAECGGIPVANMQLIPYTIVKNDKEHDTFYVSGVATLPKYRGKGLMHAMFDFCFKQMKERGIKFAFLLPADDSLRKMYEKLGFKTVSQKQVYTITPACNFSGFAEVKNINQEDIAALAKIYNTRMTAKALYAARDYRHWQLILDDLLNISGGEVWIGTDSYVILSPPRGEANRGGEVQEIMGEAPHGIKSAGTVPYAMIWSRDKADFTNDISCNYFNLLF